MASTTAATMVTTKTTKERWCLLKQAQERHVQEHQARGSSSDEIPKTARGRPRVQKSTRQRLKRRSVSNDKNKFTTLCLFGNPLRLALAVMLENRAKAAQRQQKVASQLFEHPGPTFGAKGCPCMCPATLFSAVMVARVSNR